MKRFIKYLAVLLIVLLSVTSFFSCKDPIELKLEEIEQLYSQEFRERLEQINDREILSKILEDNELISLLNDVYIWKQGWLSSLVEADYSNKDLKLIIETVKELSGKDGYSEVYLNYVFDKNFDIALSEQADLFIKFYDENYPIENIFSFLNKLEENKDYYSDVVSHFDTIIIQLRLDEIEEIYSSGLRKVIESIQDKTYKDAVLADDQVIQALEFFDSYDHADILLEKKVALDEFGITHLHEILKNENKEMIDDYIKNVTDPKNDKSIAFILNSNSGDFETGLSMQIASSFNLPYFVVHNNDGSFKPHGSEKTLDQINEGWKERGIYSLVSYFIEELNNAQINGDTDNIKIDKTKDEILSYFEETLKNYDTVYLIANIITGEGFTIYSSQGNEYISADNLYGKLNVMDWSHFKLIGNKCFDDFDKELEPKLQNDEKSYSLLSASDVVTNSPDILQAINYSNDGIITQEELKKLGEGVGSFGSQELDNGRVECYFKTDIPNYVMGLDCGEDNNFNPQFKTNSDNKSIFYIKLNPIFRK